ncbi:MAG: hypothetical protein R6V41_05980 [Desulfobacteraceae bacterium]
MQKRVWITSLKKDKEKTTALLELSKKYGLAPDGHFWVDDLKKMAWQAPKDSICAKETGLWVISAEPGDLEAESVRYGLSLLALTVQAIKGIGFPIIFVCFDNMLQQEDLPAPFKGAEIVDAKDRTLGAKIAARANTPVKKVAVDYRVDIHANPGYGIWFEFGPTGEEIWSGVLAGASGAQVDAHGVGDAGRLPEKAVLEYQMQGLKLSINNTEYDAWAVQNRISENEAYYVRFNGMPGTVLFGELPGEKSQGDFYMLRLA